MRKRKVGGFSDPLVRHKALETRRKKREEAEKALRDLEDV